MYVNLTLNFEFPPFAILQDGYVRGFLNVCKPNFKFQLLLATILNERDF